METHSPMRSQCHSLNEEVGMKEINLKIALLKHLISRYPDAIVGAEVSYLFGSRRADMVMLHEDKTTVYEIKTENDSIGRLCGQINDYKNFFDYCYVVGEPTNIKAIRKVVSNGVGIMCVTNDQVELIRESRLFKKQKKIILSSVFGIDRLKTLSGSTQSASQIDLAKVVAKKFSLPDLKAEVRRYLMSQYRGRFSILLSEIKQEITEDDIKTITQKMPVRFEIP